MPLLTFITDRETEMEELEFLPQGHAMLLWFTQLLSTFQKMHKV